MGHCQPQPDCLRASGCYLGKGRVCVESGGVKGKITWKATMPSPREMIYGDVKLQQVSPTEKLLVSQPDKRRQIGCFRDRQGDNLASACVNKNAAISPRPTMGLTPLSISRAPVIAHRGPLPSPPPFFCLSRSGRKGSCTFCCKADANAAGRGRRCSGTWWHMLPEFY